MTSKHVVFGLHAVEALLKNHPERIVRLCAYHERQDKKMESLLQLAKKNNVPVESVARTELDRLSQEENHQGIIAMCAKVDAFTESDLQQLITNLNVPPFLLILDGVQDPHNLGACFRTADAAGVHAIIAPRDNAVGITPIVSKVACGATETVPFVQVTNLARALENLKEQGIWIYGAAAEATQTLYQTKLVGPIALVMGAEGEGMRRLTRERCDGLLTIPMFGSVASLNVSVATGIVLFEAVRQRTAKAK